MLFIHCINDFLHSWTIVVLALAHKVIYLNIGYREPTLDYIYHCYRLRADLHSYDPEEVWAFIQPFDGRISVLYAGDFKFFVPDRCHTFFVIKYPDLIREELDCYV